MNNNVQALITGYAETRIIYVTTTPFVGKIRGPWVLKTEVLICTNLTLCFTRLIFEVIHSFWRVLYKKGPRREKGRTWKCHRDVWFTRKSLKITVSWQKVTLFRRNVFFRTDYWVTTFLRNVCRFVPDYTALPPSNTEVKNEWRSTVIPPIWLDGVYETSLPPRLCSMGEGSLLYNAAQLPGKFCVSEFVMLEHQFGSCLPSKTPVWAAESRRRWHWFASCVSCSYLTQQYNCTILPSPLRYT
jgi:hypothetical protein